jgi:hypothetical protein
LAIWVSMSALGQKQTLARVRVMSALPPKADIAEGDQNVRFVPNCGPARMKLLILVFNEGVRALATAGGFRVPLALVILVLNSFRMARDFLLGGGRLRRRERVSVRWKAFRKYRR